MKFKTKGLSKKLIADAVVTAVTFAALALFGFDVNQDPVLVAALAKIAGFIAGVIAGPNPIYVDPPPIEGG